MMNCLQHSLADPDLAVRAEAALALDELGHHHEFIVPTLLDGLAMQASELDLRCCRALGRLHAREALPLLLRRIEQLATDSSEGSSLARKVIMAAIQRIRLRN